jgi:hypothetical protein
VVVVGGNFQGGGSVGSDTRCEVPTDFYRKFRQITEEDRDLGFIALLPTSPEPVHYNTALPFHPNPSPDSNSVHT